LAQKLPKRLLPLVWFLFLKSRCEQSTPGHAIPFPVCSFMFHAVHQDRSKSSTVHRIAEANIIMLLVVICCCLSEQAVGDDRTARQRFVVEVSGAIRMNSVPTTARSEMSRVEISSAAEVVLALSSIEKSASSSEAVFLLLSGQACHLSIHRGSGPLKLQTVSLSGQPCLELGNESMPVLTITSI
jgi:hypothetical protein